MRRTTFLTLLLVSLLTAINPVWAKDLPEAITLGFIPGEEPVQLQKSALEIARSLQKKLNVPVNVYISKNYQGLIDSMKEKKVDFAFFTATTFVFAEKQAGAKVLLKKVWTSPFYFSSVITLKDSKYKSLKDLKGKRFAFVDEKSGSGFLYPQLEFKKQSIDSKTFFKSTEFAGNHNAAVKLLLDKKVDAVAVFADDSKAKSGAWNKFFPDQALKIKALWVSEPIPNDPFCVRQDFYDKFPKFTHDMMFALIDYKDEPAIGNLLKNLFGVNEMALATSRQYEPVREMVRELKIKME